MSTYTLEIRKGSKVFHRFEVTCSGRREDRWFESNLQSSLEEWWAGGAYEPQFVSPEEDALWDARVEEELRRLFG